MFITFIMLINPITLTGSVFNNDWFEIIPFLKYVQGTVHIMITPVREIATHRWYVNH